jgi:hypothetical protein
LVAAYAIDATVALAADFGGGDSRPGLPAVSGLNAKIGGFGVTQDGDAAGGGFVGLAFPIWWGLGAQIDGVVGNSNGGAFNGVGGHLFWRDPSRGLLGAYGSYLHWNPGNGALDIGGEIGKAGLEAQVYLGRLSLEGLSAYQFGSTEGFAGKGTIAYYPHDDFRIHLGREPSAGCGICGLRRF